MAFHTKIARSVPDGIVAVNEFVVFDRVTPEPCVTTTSAAVVRFGTEPQSGPGRMATGPKPNIATKSLRRDNLTFDGLFIVFDKQFVTRLRLTLGGDELFQRAGKEKLCRLAIVEVVALFAIHLHS